MENKYISDELLAAFLEGNVNEHEMSRVLHLAEIDTKFREVLDIALLVDEEFPVMQMAAEGGRNLCDVQCEAYVLHQLGVKASVDELFQVAKNNHWLRKAGTPLYCIGNLLEYKGLIVKRKYDSTKREIRVAVENGQCVIAAVDCDKLYPERPDEEDATNHAIVVIDIDDSDVLTIFDPENDIEVKISFSLFLSAWKESRCYMVYAIKKETL